MIWTVLRSEDIDPGAGQGPSNTVQKCKREVLNPSEVFEAIKLKLDNLKQYQAGQARKAGQANRLVGRRGSQLSTAHVGAVPNGFYPPVATIPVACLAVAGRHDKFENGSFQ